MSMPERLRGYYPFNDNIIGRVAEVTDQLRSFPDYEKLFDYVRIGEPQPHFIDGYLPSQIIDVRRSDEDPEKTIIAHLAMAQPLDPNQLYMIAVLGITFPEYRIIAAGNPSEPGYKAGRLKHRQRKQTSQGDFGPTVIPVLDYVANRAKIEQAVHLGDSLGADLAATAAGMDFLRATQLVATEPVTVVSRSTIQLGRDFSECDQALKDYVHANELNTYLEARKHSVGGNRYIAGLFRLTNIAMARGLTKPYFLTRMHTAMSTQPGMRSTVVWGGKSELAIDENVQEIVSQLQEAYGADTVKSIRIPEGRHAMTADLALRSAIMLQAINS
jgi:hypothetical protein